MWRLEIGDWRLEILFERFWSGFGFCGSWRCCVGLELGLLREFFLVLV